MPCPVDVHETLCEQATIRITPNVTIVEVETVCVGEPAIGPCPGTVVAFCDITVHQSICVEADLLFAANAEVIAAALVCGTPATGECNEEG